MLLIIFGMTVSCGKNNKDNPCMNLMQVRALCIAEGIQLRPAQNVLWTVELDCERRYQVEACFQKQDKYFPYEN